MGTIKTVKVTLFFILFLSSFDMHAQMPLLAPYAQSLGASAMLIGVLLSAYSSSNLVGNLIAGPILDRYSKPFLISGGLFLAGLLLIAQGTVDEFGVLLLLRFVFGFVMAFVTPACFAMLGELGRTSIEQGNVMAKNGMVMTIASMVSPVVGGYLASHAGYHQAFQWFGVIMLVAGAVAIWRLPVRRQKIPLRDSKTAQAGTVSMSFTKLMLAYLTGFCVLYAQGTLMFEVPLLIERNHLAPSVTGSLFGVMGVGSLTILSIVALHRIAPQIRCLVGLGCLGLIMYGLAVGVNFPLQAWMLSLGVCFGMLFPAMSTILTQQAPRESYGTAFSIFSAVLSIGAMTGPLIAGTINQMSLSFFVAFVFAFLACILFLWHSIRTNIAESL
ncbi:MFS transporter [Brevibacillus ginsengisoli]|uniref:MFS transporter n=1 Tax=Brevibacillus ginsengisoli TaxID=363854 RepID=UPI003CF6DFF8